MLHSESVEKIKVVKHLVENEGTKFNRKLIDKSKRINSRSMRKLQEALYKNLYTGE